MNKIYLYILLVSFFVAAPLISRATVLLSDDFVGNIASSASWHIPTWVSSTDGTYLGQTQFMCTQNASLPSATNGNTNIIVQSYNPKGFSFYGTDLISNQQFSVAQGQGIDITVRAKMATATPGIVGGIFLYALKPGSNTLHDEIDFEMLTNTPNQVQTNIYGNEPLGTGHPQFVNYVTGSITDYHTYKIRWMPTQVSWYVDGTLVRTSTTSVPAGPMNFHLNMWVPNSTWVEAYSANLKPVSSSGTNQVFTMNVDSVNVQSISTTPTLSKITVSPASTTLAPITSPIVYPLPINFVPTGTIRLTASTLDQFNNPISSTVTWTSSNTAVATVNASGLVIPLAPGTANITASSKGILSAPSVITVTNYAGPVLKKIVLSPITATLSPIKVIYPLPLNAVPSGALKLKATTLDQNNNPISSSLNWTSNNPSVANVTTTGVVIPISPGTANITAGYNGVVSVPTVITVTNPYHYSVVNVGTQADKIEYRLYKDQAHFLTVLLDGNNAVSIRPHPGLDGNGWGSSFYLQPFLPSLQNNAVLRGTNIQAVTVKNNGIEVLLSGTVSLGNSSTYGNWQADMIYSFDSLQKHITGSGTYNINLAGALNTNTSDLNICKLSSNYLANVSLLNGTTGDTGDMTVVNVTGSPFNFTWNPKNGSTFPQENRNPMTIEIVGNYNQIKAPGVLPAYKPTMKVTLSLNQASGYKMIFGGTYTAHVATDFSADNVGITPIILKSSTPTVYSFNVGFDSTAIAGDH